MAEKPTSVDEKMLAMNEALTVAALRQHELTEAADSANVQLRAEIAERKRAEFLVNSQKQALQLLAEDASLEAVLEFLISVVERESGDGMLAAITLLNEAGTHFQRGIGASLPDEFNAAVEGVAINSPSGLCANAVTRREPIAVNEFNESAEWQAFGQFVAPYGLRSGWSTPIASSSGRILGTFANYFRHACDPTPKNQELVEMVIGTAAVAIERKQAEEVLHQSEERFRSLVSIITDVPWVTDASGEFITPQPEWEAYTGQTWEEHRDFGWAKAIHPEDREQVKEIWQRACESHMLYQSEGRLWHAPTQQWRCFKAKATPLLNADGTVREWVGTCTDCEDQKRAEQERERLLKSEREARTQAEEANRVKDQFLATVSHELRTPLNAILGWAHMLKRGTLDEDTTTRGLETIARNATAQNQLISDLLDISRIISGQLRCEMGAVDLIPVIEAAVDTVRPAADARAVELRLTLDPAAGMVSGDAARLQQIVSNLLTNAVKFTSRNGRVDVELKRQDTSVVIIVTDTGEGISPEFLPYIFDRFRQAEGTASRQHGGLGLGLAIVRHLVELHGGTVRAISEGVGKGATFTVAFPLIAVTRDADLGIRKEDAAAEQSATRNPQAAILAGVRVLVVDDEPDARELLTIALKQSGAEVRASTTAREALEALDQWKPDVLVSDIGMPGEDGYELIRKIRALKPEQGGTIPAVALTGYASDEDAVRARGAGYQLHLPKPVSPSELVAKVASLARKARHA